MAEERQLSSSHVSHAEFETIVNNVLKDFPNIESLREEQKDCLNNLVSGRDVFAILPTGFGKSLIFQLFPRIMKAMNGKDDAASTILVVTPLVAIMKDQVEQLNRIGVTATAIGLEHEEGMDVDAAKSGRCEIVYGSPESLLSKEWRKELQDGQLGKQIVAIAIDEVHSITEWGMSQESSRKKRKDPFREAFGRVKDLRSLLPGAPVIALTASVLLKDRYKVIKASGMHNPAIVDVSPNKENISLDFLEMKNESYAGSNIQWIAEMVSCHGKETPQTIIFCKTFNSISFVFSYLLMALRGKAFVTSENQTKISLIGVYHAKTWDKEKHQIEEDFKKNGFKRVVIATCALGMGVNFPHVRYVIQYTPPNTLVDMMQQAGRGGRDGLQSHTIVYYTRQQLSQCSKDVKTVVNHEGCQRIELYSNFSESDLSVEPGHKCCSNCRKACKCEGEKCGDEQPFLRHEVNETPSVSDHQQVRELSETDLIDLKLSMEELQEQYSACGPSLFHPESSHGFSDQLIENIVQHAPFIYSAEYLHKHLSMFTSKHVMDVLEVLQELFEDINDYEEQIEELDLIHHEVSQAEDYLLESIMSEGLSDEALANSGDLSEEFYQLQEFELLF